MDADGTDQLRLLVDDGVDVSPAWSRDGKQVAFVGGGEDEGFIDVVAIDGSSRMRLTEAGEDWNPAWSPDDRHIAFTSGRGGTNDLYVMNVDGSDQRVLVRRPDVYEDDAAWSRDGARLAFRSDL